MKRIVVLILGILALTLTACGGGSTSTTTQAPKPTVSSDCAKGAKNTAAICILRGQPRPPRFLAPPKAVLARGLDSWGPPSLSVIDGNYQFGAAYLSYDPSKNWTLGAVRAYRAAGKGVVMAWETTATRAGDGFAAGVSDAHEAARQATALGNTSGPIIFAVDFDASCGQIIPYFHGVHSVLGSRDNAYGGYFQVLCLFQHHVVSNQNWQAYAWSGGRWLPASIAPLEQWLNGRVYDYNRALLPNYGQAFQAAPKPADPYAVMDTVKRHFSNGVVASEHNTMTTWHKHHCRNPVKREVCKSSRYHLVLLVGRVDWLKGNVYHSYRWDKARARRKIMSKALSQR